MFSKLAVLTLLPLAFAAPTQAPTKYIVVLKSGSQVESITSNLDNVQVTHNYNIGDFKGFAANLNSANLAALRADPNVAYIEADGRAHIYDAVTQSGAPWGLGRVSHRSKGATDYLFDPSAGAGTCSYIIDTGILVDHPEFEGRATFVKSFTGVNTDDHGHGTHVSGTIGSASYGVAKKTSLYGIKVLDAQGSGAWTDIVSGIQTAVSDSQTRSCPNGVVVNMSLGGGKQQSVNDAVAAAVKAGLFFAVAAGNDGVDFANSSPASEPLAFAVGASDSTDKLASFSNYGKTLAVIAPGVDILSTWNDGKTNTISGTSMATPHVVGLAAYLAGVNGAQTPASMKALIQKLATTEQVSLGLAALSGTPNLLAYNGIA